MINCSPNSSLVDELDDKNADCSFDKKSKVGVIVTRDEGAEDGAPLAEDDGDPLGEDVCI